MALLGLWACSLAAVGCWTGTATIVERDIKPARRHVRAHVGCWTKQFYEMWPAQVWLGDITAACELEYPGEYDMIATCTVMRLSREYDRIWAWNVRWFEACSPSQ